MVVGSAAGCGARTHKRVFGVDTSGAGGREDHGIARPRKVPVRGGARREDAHHTEAWEVRM